LKAAAAFAFALAAFIAALEADPRYFPFVGDVQIHEASRQNFLVLDAGVFQRARGDLADLRLYDGERQVPYQLSEARARSSREEHSAAVLNLAAKGDHTEFDLDMQGVSEYDSIRLRLKAKNFVVKAWAAGSDALAGKAPAPWPTPSTLYDFSAEKLGSNFIIKLPTWSFRYVHVRLGPGIAPQQVEGASVSNQQERQAFYTPMGSCRPVEPKPHESVWHCDLPDKVPLDRILFQVAPQNVNFRRAILVQDERGEQVATGELSRIRTRRGGNDVIAEELAVPMSGTCRKSATIVIENGDDAPLAIGSVSAQSFERRLYFEPGGASVLRWYFGDEKLQAPVYDYAKMFHEDAAAAQPPTPPTPRALTIGRGRNAIHPCSGAPCCWPWWCWQLWRSEVLRLNERKSARSGPSMT